WLDISTLQYHHNGPSDDRQRKDHAATSQHYARMRAALIWFERFKLALFNSVAKKDKVSEKAYLCLNIAWLLRGKGEELAANPEAKEEDKAKCKAEEDAFYAQAYDGLYKAIQSESFPMCGMDEATMSVLLAEMAFKLGKIENAGRLVSSVLTSPSANQRMKNKALELKEKIIEEMKKKKAAGK
nr:DUF2225 domain-containing protein [Lachnospiraceae bacterium]